MRKFLTLLFFLTLFASAAIAGAQQTLGSLSHLQNSCSRVI